MSDLTCDICHRKFKSEPALIGHQKAHSKEERAEAKKRRRIPAGVRRTKLDANIPEGKVGRWVNDTPGRIARFLEGGYQFVEDRDSNMTIGEDGEKNDNSGAHRMKRVGTTKSGAEQNAYLMVIDKDMYEEDQIAKEMEGPGRIEAAMKLGGKLDENIKNASDRDKFYSPKGVGGISIQSG